MTGWWRRLLTYARPHAGSLGFIVVAMLTAVAFDALRPWPLKLLVDFVGKQERLSEDFREVCDRVGIEAELPMLNVRPHRDNEPAYDELRRRVKEAFPDVYRTFEYS